MLGATQVEQRAKLLVDAIVSLYDALARLAVADIAWAWTKADRPASLANLARSRMVRPQLGYQHELVRAWLRACEGVRRRTPLGDPRHLARAVFTEKPVGDLINLRSFVTKRATEAKERLRAAPEWLPAQVAAAREALLGLEGLERSAFGVVVDSGGDRRRVTRALRGAFAARLPRGADVDEAGHAVVWVDRAGAVWPVTPLVTQVACGCAVCNGAIVACWSEWPSAPGATPGWFAIYDGHAIRCDALTDEFGNLKAALSADWRWQHAPYLAGHMYRALADRALLSIQNLFGDTANNDRIVLERILAEDPAESTFKVDDHDRTPPIPDHVFGLKVRDVRRDDLFEIDPEEQYIWSDGFRSFAVGSRRRWSSARCARCNSTCLSPACSTRSARRR